MPNHVHGIIQIKEETGTRRGEVASPQTGKGDETSPLRKASLGNIVAYFKYQATKRVNSKTVTPGNRVFQRNYYDHIIRDDIDHFFVDRYVELNPLMWQLDRDNPTNPSLSIEELRRILKEERGLDGITLEGIIEYESGYRAGVDDPY